MVNVAIYPIHGCYGVWYIHLHWGSIMAVVGTYHALMIWDGMEFSFVWIFNGFFVNCNDLGICSSFFFCFVSISLYPDSTIVNHQAPFEYGFFNGSQVSWAFVIGLRIYIMGVFFLLTWINGSFWWYISRETNAPVPCSLWVWSCFNNLRWQFLGEIGAQKIQNTRDLKRDHS